MRGDENQVSSVIVDSAVKVHSRLGPGLLESVYEVVLERELVSRGMDVKRQVPVEINYEGIVFEEGFRADLVVNECVLLELKSVEQMHKIHSKQLFTYLRLTNIRLGLLLNFGAPLMKEGIKRVANGM
ncbi:MAG: GxxExxY protein [Opitutales bacterium]